MVVLTYCFRAETGKTNWVDKEDSGVVRRDNSKGSLFKRNGLVFSKTVLCIQYTLQRADPQILNFATPAVYRAV